MLFLYGLQRLTKKSSLAALESATETFYTDVGRYPYGLGELVPDLNDPTRASEYYPDQDGKWKGPYVKQKEADRIKDGWGHKIHYEGVANPAPGQAPYYLYD